MTDWCTDDGKGLLVRIKAVPGAKRPGVAGVLGDRLKVKVSQPPEGGKANKAIIQALADLLGVPVSSITLVEGQTSPAKTFRIDDVTTAHVRERLDG
jgi:hypothetical protein